MTHCINCGIPNYSGVWPKHCTGAEDAQGWHEGCGHIMYQNPIPVVTLLQPVYDGPHVVGLAIAQRADNLGWALLAGHVDPGETLEEAVVRELLEETGIERVPAAVSYFTSQFTPTQVMTAFTLPPMTIADWNMAVLCPENLAFNVYWERSEIPLVFPPHRELVARYFEDLH